MVKPALPYLDIIADAAELARDHPIACYQVSGEFAMVHAGAKAGVYDLKTMAFETTESMVRAGGSHLPHVYGGLLTIVPWKALRSFCLTSLPNSSTGCQHRSVVRIKERNEEKWNGGGLSDRAK